MPLTPSRRSELRAQAHTLSPIVLIGDKGLTDEVIAEIDRSLKAHELIKVRAMTNDRDARVAWMATICEKLDAQAIQQIGKVLVIYRENFDKPRDKPKLDAGPVSRTRGARDDKDGKRKRPDDRSKPLDDKRKRLGDKRRPLADKRTRLDALRKPMGDKRKPLADKRIRLDDMRKPMGDKRRPLGDKRKPPDDTRDAKRTARPRSRTPSALPESEPRRRRPRSSR
jgi:RNA-binding protein